MEILFKDYFKAAFTRCVEGYQRQHPNDGKLELSIEAYDETAIDPRVDINITTKRLQGNQVNNTISLPYQIMFTLTHDLYLELKGAFEYFVNEFSEKETLMPTDEDTYVKVYPQYSPHYVLTTNADLGSAQGTIVTISANLVYGLNGKEVVKCKKGIIGLYDSKKTFDTEDILITNIGIGASYTTNTTGQLAQGNKQKATNQTVLNVYTLSFIPFISVKYAFNEESGNYEPDTKESVIDQILSNIIDGKNINQLYYLELPIGNKTYTKICRITNPTSYSDSIGSYSNITISFVEA